MDNLPVEIEVKFLITNLSNLEEKIKKLGGTLLHNHIFQRTVLFDLPSGELASHDTFLRIRSGEKKVMTVKTKIATPDSSFKERQELEIEISDVSLAEKMLETLGYTTKRIMEKYRTEYSLGDVVLALDHLSFGDYLEIEGNKASIEKAITSLDLNDLPRLTVSYWELFADYQTAQQKTGQDIVFKETN